MQEPQGMRVQPLGREDPMEKEVALTPVFLLRESHGQKSLVGCSPRGRRESDTTEQLSMQRFTEKLRGRHRDSPLTLWHTHAQLLPLPVSPIRAAHLLQLMSLHWPIIITQSPSLTLGVTLHTHYSKRLNTCVMTCIHYYSIIRVFPLLWTSSVLTSSSPLPDLASGSPWSFCYFHSFAFFRVFYIWNHTICSPFRMASFT